MKNIVSTCSSLLLFFLVSCFYTSAQELKPRPKQLKLVKQADKKFEEKGYATAILMYEKALKMNDEKYALDAAGMYNVNLNLAHSYRLTGNPFKAEQFYEKAVTSNPAMAGKNMFWYARMLQANKKYETAKAKFDEYAAKTPEDKKGKAFSEVCSRIIAGDFTAKTFDVQTSSFNSPASDFSASYYRNGLVFASTRGNGGDASDKSEWNGEPYSDLYFATAGETGELNEVTRFPSKLNTGFNEGAACFNKDFSEVFFTRNRYYNGSEKNSATNVNKLSVFRSTSSGKWSKPEPLPFTHKDYNFAHPCLSSDGKTLYFSSDMPGGQGGMDIWKVTRKDTSWAKPENLGAVINTSENETFPFIHEDGTLFFASEGHPGLGGLDIFSVKNDNGNWVKVSNLKQPVNSSRDDFGYISDRRGETGYFSSNRNGNDDIFSFSRTGGNTVEQQGRITDKLTGNPLQGARVELLANNAGKGEVHITDESGQFYFESDNTTAYDVKISKEMYVEQTLPGKKLNESFSVQLAPKEKAQGQVTDKITGKPIEGARVELLGSFDNKGEIVMSGSLGEFLFEVLIESPYELKISKENYANILIPAAETHKLRKSKFTQINVQMSLEQPPTFSNINFDKDKWIILPAGRGVLDSVITYMKTNTASAIEISAFTDSKGSELYNLGLSVKRADAAVKYLTENGIPKDRIVTNFYGDQVLTAKCDNDPKCIERERKENRRIELKAVARLKP